jgi:hypothetical protein
MATEEKNAAAPAMVDAGVSAPDPALIDSNDDMYDLPAELEGNELLPRALRILSTICAPYWKANDRAIQLQKTHRRITNFALCFATLAVGLAIVQLSILPTLGEEGKKLLAGIEFFAALFALIFVTWGIRLAVQKHWLLERHKAERLRFLKYQSILHLLPAARVDPSLKDWTQIASRKASIILKLEESDLERYLEENHDLTADEKALSFVASGGDLNEILDYYQRKRLEPQVGYFFKKAHSTLQNDWITRLLPPILFLASLAAALLHFGIDFADMVLNKMRSCLPYWMEGWGIPLITAAAILPVLGAAVRTLRSANEYSRNTVRFSSMYQQLHEASKKLPELANTRAKLETLWECEESLEVEHWEWLRLMNEAEWFG